MKYVIRSIGYLFGYTLIVGVFYPLVITAVANLLFPHQAGGSALSISGTVVGSELLGQQFESQKYFHGRPSATSPSPYSALASSGSNLALSNPAFKMGLEQRLRQWGADAALRVPVDLVTASASGLDPHISPVAAYFQVRGIAQARGIAPSRIEQLISERSEVRVLGMFGESRINVLKLNIELDKL